MHNLSTGKRLWNAENDFNQEKNGCEGRLREFVCGWSSEVEYPSTNLCSKDSWQYPEDTDEYKAIFTEDDTSVYKWSSTHLPGLGQDWSVILLGWDTSGVNGNYGIS